MLSRSHLMPGPTQCVILTPSSQRTDCSFLVIGCRFWLFKMVLSLVLTVSVNLKGHPTPFETQASPPPPPSHMSKCSCACPSLKGHMGGEGKFIFPVALVLLNLELRAPDTGLG